MPRLRIWRQNKERVSLPAETQAEVLSRHSPDSMGVSNCSTTLGDQPEELSQCGELLLGKLHPITASKHESRPSALQLLAVPTQRMPRAYGALSYTQKQQIPREADSLGFLGRQAGRVSDADLAHSPCHSPRSWGEHGLWDTEQLLLQPLSSPDLAPQGWLDALLQTQLASSSQNQVPASRREGSALSFCSERSLSTQGFDVSMSTAINAGDPLLEEVSDREAALQNPVADFLPAWFSPRLHCISWERRTIMIHV